MKTLDKSRLIAFNGNKLLVLEKVGVKKKYSLAGGISKKHETDYDSLIRETLEEIGVQLRKKDVTYFISRKSINKEKREVCKHYFLTNLIVKEIKVLEHHKFKKALWVNWYDALDYLDKEDRFVVKLCFGQFEKRQIKI